eukprot:TRINITY_DN17166_c0_g1_i1.p2 TRINITY_DN17166_c0_g1~~TRINITY_DN17166_c0_g1_i1.p2  ORF type:complete len:100 (-),score=5.92 TRINITY_DN17166_c0_g1_i1:45-344(-)
MGVWGDFLGVRSAVAERTSNRCVSRSREVGVCVCVCVGFLCRLAVFWGTLALFLLVAQRVASPRKIFDVTQRPPEGLSSLLSSLVSSSRVHSLRQQQRP